MNNTVFLHIETNLNDDSGFPTAISWSLPDTRIKSVLIIPDDDWLDAWYDSQNATTGLDNNYHQGASCTDIARELQHDLDGRYVYVTDETEQSRLAEMLFDSAGTDAPFEILPASELFQRSDHQVNELCEQVMAEQGLEKTDGNNVILALLLTAREYQLL
ncbi:MAG: hypothetical protein CSB48_05140 [Proteobacteria bacterium]|nr:MAG: hypothetical protein CSB48_05140 [Pseudomonadota bacterium]PIE40257.1 MAG: hypothetical protein CSA51_01620 [Gammaproteobacteria bacterium]